MITNFQFVDCATKNLLLFLRVYSQIIYRCIAEKVVYNLAFNRKKRLNAEGKVLIQIEVYLNRQKRYFSTKVYVKPCQWDNKRRSIKNHPGMDALNLYLQNYVMELEKDELEKRQANNGFSLKDLREEVSLTSTSPSFLVFMCEGVLYSNLKESTLKNHLSTLHVLLLYKKDVLFKDTNFNFLRDFEYFLLKREYYRNTIAKHMKHLERYIDLATNKGLFELRKYPFRKYKIKYQESKRTYLTSEELGHSENLKLDRQRTLCRCLDMFLSSCYMGLRFSNIVNITKENFLITDDEVWLVYSSVKTDVSVRLPLLLSFESKSLSIYEQYKNAPRTLFGVPLSSGLNVNKQLRRISRLASIDKKVSFHTAWRTNATLLLYNGANITTVRKLLGHKNARITEICSSIIDITIIRDLKRIETRSKFGQSVDL